MASTSERHRHHWAAGNAALTTAVVVLIELSRLGDGSPSGFRGLVSSGAGARLLTWTEQDR